MTIEQATLDRECQRLKSHGLRLLERYRDRTRPRIVGPLVSAGRKVAVILCGETRKRVDYRDLEREGG